MVHDSGWHPFTVTVLEGCRAEGRLCTSYCPEPCEDTNGITLDCDANGCPAPSHPDGPRCSLAEAVDFLGPDDFFDQRLTPGPYLARLVVTADHLGERDELVEVHRAPDASAPAAS
jgi:hypothetical protein